jgi:hypothetical protein
LLGTALARLRELEKRELRTTVDERELILTETKVMNEPFLPPIEKPKGLIKNLVYAMSRRQFGKVLTPVKVYAARLPNAFGTFFGKVAALDKKLLLPHLYNITNIGMNIHSDLLCDVSRKSRTATAGQAIAAK